eukprot:4094018-Prymnesium_polylepis.2
MHTSAPRHQILDAVDVLALDGDVQRVDACDARRARGAGGRAAAASHVVGRGGGRRAEDGAAQRGP